MEEQEEITPIETEKKSNNMMYVGIAAVVLVLLGGIFLMNRKSSTEEASESMGTDQMAESTLNTMTPAVEGASSSARVVTDNGITTVTMEAGSFYYKPNEVKVKKGDKVKIVMNSVDMLHNFNIDELNVHLPMTKSGETNTVEFTADKVGTFQYYCSVGQHRQHGQVGNLIVE